MKSIVGLRKLVWVSLALVLSVAFLAGVAFAQSKDAKPQAGAQSSKQISVVGTEPGGATVPPLPPDSQPQTVPPIPSVSTESPVPSPPGDAKFEITLNVDKPEDTPYKIGDPIVLTFSTNKDCHLTLLNVGTSGNVSIIFPNSYQKDNFVKAQVDYKVPPAEGATFGFQLNGPEGDDVIKAIATLDNVPAVDPAAVKTGTGVFSDTTYSSKDIAVIEPIAPPPVGGTGETKKLVKGVNWTEAQKIVRVTQ